MSSLPSVIMVVQAVEEAQEQARAGAACASLIAVIEPTKQVMCTAPDSW